MPVHAGVEGTVKVGSDTIGEVTSFTLDHTADTVETTAMGQSFRSRIVTLQSFSGSVEVFFNEGDAGQTAATVGSSLTFELYPEGADSGDTYFSGTGLVTGKNVNSTVDGMVTQTITFEGTGGLTTTTV
jgi:hypothetical protein